MRLDTIIKDSGSVLVCGDGKIEISAICCDSRKVIPGSLFVAVKGFASDGHRFIASAISKGAAAIVFEDAEITEDQINASEQKDIALIKAESARYALAIIAANFYDNPSRKLTLVGITGTNGKTTTNNMIYKILTDSGKTVVCNRLGANMIEGVIVAFINNCTLTGKLKADFACLEIDMQEYIINSMSDYELQKIIDESMSTGAAGLIIMPDSEDSDFLNFNHPFNRNFHIFSNLFRTRFST